MGNPASSKLRAIVVGGSLGGLFAGHFLRHIGWDVEIFERAPGNLSGRGAGLGARHELFSAVSRLGLEPDGSITTDVRSRIHLGMTGEIVAEVPLRGIGTAWDSMYRLLRCAFPDRNYHAGSALLHFGTDASGVRAAFSDGSRMRADLLIGADGGRSTVRRQLLPALEPEYAGYVAWRCVVQEADVRPDFREQAFNHMNFCFPEGEFALIAPMSREPGRAQGRCQISWYRPVSHARLLDLCTDSEGHCHGTSIPPPLIRADIIEEMKTAAKTMLPLQVADLLQRAQRPILQPIFDLESPSLVFGRTILLGDSGFVARPHVGTGVTKAALDAQTLADEILGNVGNLELALRRYNDARVEYGRKLVRRGRHLGAYLSAQNKAPVQRTEHELYRNPYTFMQEFGSAAIDSE